MLRWAERELTVNSFDDMDTQITLYGQPKQVDINSKAYSREMPTGFTFTFREREIFLSGVNVFHTSAIDNHVSNEQQFKDLLKEGEIRFFHNGQPIPYDEFRGLDGEELERLSNLIDDGLRKVQDSMRGDDE